MKFERQKNTKAANSQENTISEKTQVFSLLRKEAKRNSEIY